MAYKTCGKLALNEIIFAALSNMAFSTNIQFAFHFLILCIFQQISSSFGCTPAGSGCCSSPRPASCGNLPPCSPGSMSASHLSSYSHVAPPPPKPNSYGHGHHGGGYGHEEGGGEYGYNNDGYESGGYYPPSESYGNNNYGEKMPKYGGGGYISKPMYPSPPPPPEYPYSSYSSGGYGQLPSSGYGQSNGYGQPSPYQPPPIQPAPPPPPSLSSYAIPPLAYPSPQPAYPIAPPPPAPVYSISPPPSPYPLMPSTQYPQLYSTATPYNGGQTLLNSYYPTNSIGTFQYNEPLNSGAYSGPMYGYDSVGAMPPAIAPSSYPQPGIGGEMYLPPNGPFLMNLANAPTPPGGYKLTKKKILLVEKAKGKATAASVAAKTTVSAKDKKERK